MLTELTLEQRRERLRQSLTRSRPGRAPAHLPGHGSLYRDLHGALRDIRARNQARLEAVAAACVRPVTAAELAARSRDWAPDATEAYLKIGEALGVLNHLAAIGRLTMQPGGSVRRFVRRI